jgi:hypothetical protein
VRADEEAEAFLVLDSFDSSQSVSALIQLSRGDTVCAVCTLEQHVEDERRALEYFLSKPRPPWATERAQARLDLLASYRSEQPFNPDDCPAAPCLSDPRLAAQQGAAADERPSSPSK